MGDYHRGVFLVFEEQVIRFEAHITNGVKLELQEHYIRFKMVLFPGVFSSSHQEQVNKVYRTQFPRGNFGAPGAHQ